MKTNQSLNYEGYKVGDLVWVYDGFCEFIGQLPILGITVDVLPEEQGGTDTRYYIEVPILSKEARQEYDGETKAPRYLTAEDIFDNAEDCIVAAVKDCDEFIRYNQEAVNSRTAFRERITHRGTE